MVAYFLPCYQMRFPVQQTQQLNREPQVAFAMSIIKSLFSKPGASTSTWLFAVSLSVIHGTYWKRKSYWYMRCYRSKVDHFARVEASIASLVFVLLLGATWSREWWMGITSSYNLTCYSYFFCSNLPWFFRTFEVMKKFRFNWGVLDSLVASSVGAASSHNFWSLVSTSRAKLPCCTGQSRVVTFEVVMKFMIALVYSIYIYIRINTL